MKHYVYQHIRLDNNQPFYIGVGQGQRAYIKTGRNPIWNDIYNKCNGYKVEIINDEIEFEDAKKLEVILIEKYGRICKNTGILANITKGGEGVQSISQEVKDKIAIANTGKKRTDDFKVKRSLLKLGTRHTDETKEKMRVSRMRVQMNMDKKIYSDKERMRCSINSKNEKNPNYKGLIIAIDKNGNKFTFANSEEIRNFLNLTVTYNLTGVYASISGRRKYGHGYMWIRPNIN